MTAVWTVLAGAVIPNRQTARIAPILGSAMACELILSRDFHLRAEGASPWQQRYAQLSPGRMRSALASRRAGGVQVFRKWMSERVVQQGCVPAGQVCLAALGARGEGTPRMQGRELLEDRLFLLRGGQEFDLQRTMGMELLAVSLPAETLRELLDQCPWPAEARRLLARDAVQAPPALLMAWREGLLALLERPVENAAYPLFERLGALLRSASGSRQAAGSASAGFIVAECQRLVEASPQQPPSIEALCRRLRVSRRGLQSSFRQVADTTPVHYLRSLRLNRVRDRLTATSAPELGVSQAAQDQGFTHLSHFAARYRALFGELPSQSTRRPA